MTFGWNLFKIHSEGKSSFDSQVFIDMFPSYLFMTVSCSSCQGCAKYRREECIKIPLILLPTEDF